MIEMDDEEIIVKEIDIVVSPDLSFGGSVDGERIPMVLQFPLREKDRPYPTMSGNPRVKYKYTVKRMHWDIPLDVDGAHYYDADFDDRKQIRQFSLKSSRVHQGVRGMCVGMMKGNILHLIPVQEVMQLRPSPNHLDKQSKEGSGQRDTVGKVEAVHGEAGRRNDLQPITVQIKKHETEQQTEARLRSYAFHAQKDEADVWCDLAYCGERSRESAAVRTAIENSSIAEELTDESHIPKEMYLDELVGSASLALSGPQSMEHGNGMTTTQRREGHTTQDIGKPAKTIQSKEKSRLGVSANLTSDSATLLETTLDRLFEESTVLSLDRIRKSLLKPHMSNHLQKIGHTGSDDELHACIMSLNQYIHVRNAYVRQLRGDSILDPLRSIIVDILQENEVIKRSDVMDKANELGVAVTDNMYSRVMKELCISKGALWSMKSGD